MSPQSVNSAALPLLETDPHLAGCVSQLPGRNTRAWFSRHVRIGEKGLTRVVLLFPVYLNGRNLTLPDSSAGKGSACNAGDPGLIPGSERSPGEGKGFPLQYSWASLVAQLVKNLPAIQETWVGSLGWEDPLEEGIATHSSVLAWRAPWTQPMG